MDLSFYIFATVGIIGFLYVLVSFLLGEVGHAGELGGVEVEHDLDALHAGMDHDVGLHAEHHADFGDGDAPGPFSTRVLAVFLAAFGMVGAAARYTGLTPLTSAAAGLGGGYGFGWLAWRLLRLVWSQGASSHIRAQDLVGQHAEVTVAVPASGVGQVACIVNGVRTYQIARSASGGDIPLGTHVRIVHVTAEGVSVEPVPRERSAVPEQPQRRL